MYNRSGDITTSGLTSAILEIGMTPLLRVIGYIAVRFLVFRNVEISLEITQICITGAEILLLPV